MTGKLKHVLLVDDEPDIQSIVRLALERVGGMSVTVCDSGLEALQYLKIAPHRPDLVLLDMMMPGMDGLETMQAIQESWSGLPIVFITARSWTHDMIEAQRPEVLGVITKPFDPMQLAEQIRGMYYRRRTS